MMIKNSVLHQKHFKTTPVIWKTCMETMTRRKSKISKFLTISAIVFETIRGRSESSRRLIKLCSTPFGRKRSFLGKTSQNDPKVSKNQNFSKICWIFCWNFRKLRVRRKTFNSKKRNSERTF